MGIVVIGGPLPKGDQIMNAAGKFGDEVVGGAVVTANVSGIQCTAPMHKPGTVMVRASLDPDVYPFDDAEEVPLLYPVTPSITSVTPSSGHVLGGTLLTIQGLGFEKTEGLACGFLKAGE